MAKNGLPVEVENLMTEDLLAAFNEIQMPRTPFVLKHFVVDQHDTDVQRYFQCVLELQIKYDAIRRSLLGRERSQIEQSRLLRQAAEAFGAGEIELSKMMEIDAKLKGLDIEEQDRAMLGALREFQALHAIFVSFPDRFTREDIDKDQVNYWQKRLTRQAEHDIQAVGRVQAGNLDALRMAGMSVPRLGCDETASNCQDVPAISGEIPPEETPSSVHPSA